MRYIILMLMLLSCSFLRGETERFIYVRGDLNEWKPIPDGIGYRLQLGNHGIDVRYNAPYSHHSPSTVIGSYLYFIKSLYLGGGVGAQVKNIKGATILQVLSGIKVTKKSFTQVEGNWHPKRLKEPPTILVSYGFGF